MHSFWQESSGRRIQMMVMSNEAGERCESPINGHPISNNSNAFGLGWNSIQVDNYQSIGVSQSHHLTEDWYPFWRKGVVVIIKKATLSRDSTTISSTSTCTSIIIINIPISVLCLAILHFHQYMYVKNLYTLFRCDDSIQCF